MKLPLGKVSVLASTVLWLACSASPAQQEAPFEEDPLPDAGKTGSNDPAPDTVDDGDPLPDAGSGGDAYAPDPKLGLSKGCERTDGATGLQTKTKTIAGVARGYDRFIPAAYKPKTPMMLIVALHGSGGTKEGARSSFDLEAQADGQAIILYPQALPSKDPAFDGANRWDPDKGSADYEFFDAIVEEAGTTHCINRDRLFVVGFSLGARFGAMLGCYRGNVIRALGLGAPGGNEKTLPLEGCVGEVALWEGLGTKDDEHKEGAERVRQYYLGANACGTSKKEATPKGCEAYDGCRSGTAVTFCSYDLAHMWPTFGSSAVLNFFNRYK